MTVFTETENSAVRWCTNIFGIMFSILSSLFIQCPGSTQSKGTHKGMEKMSERMESGFCSLCVLRECGECSLEMGKKYAERHKLCVCLCDLLKIEIGNVANNSMKRWRLRFSRVLWAARCELKRMNRATHHSRAFLKLLFRIGIESKSTEEEGMLSLDEGESCQ